MHLNNLLKILDFLASMRYIVTELNTYEGVPRLQFKPQ